MNPSINETQFKKSFVRKLLEQFDPEIRTQPGISYRTTVARAAAVIHERASFRQRLLR